MKTKTRKKLRKGKDSTKIIIKSRQFMSDDTSVNVSGMMVTTKRVVMKMTIRRCESPSSLIAGLIDGPYKPQGFLKKSGEK